MGSIIGGFFGVVDSTWNDKPADTKSSSLQELFQEFVFLPFMGQQSIDGSHSYTEVDKKSSLPWIVLLISITGVVIVHIYNSIPSSTNNQYNDKAYMRQVINQYGGLYLGVASKELKGDKKMVLFAVQKDGLALQYASNELKGDMEVVQAAVQQNPFALQAATEELKGNKELVLVAVQRCFLTFRYASKKFKDDRDVMLAVVQQSGVMLKHANERLKDDRDLVLVAVQEDGMALRYASARLQADSELQRLAGVFPFNEG